MSVSRTKQFFITFIAFLAIGIPFMVMVIVERFTGIRPVNAIPPVAGLLFGPVGAIASGIANIFVDLFGTFGASSVLGIIANFIAALLPFRLWHLFSNEPPNMHSIKNILLYIGVCLVSALTVAWFLSFGLYTFFGVWIVDIYILVFFNNFGFSVAFGMPILIILTSDSVSIICRKPMPHILLRGFGVAGGQAYRKTYVRNIVCGVYAVVMLVICVSVFIGLCPQEDVWLHAFSAVSLAGLIVQLI